MKACKMLSPNLYVNPDCFDFQDVGEAPEGVVAEFVHEVADVMFLEDVIGQSAVDVDVPIATVRATVSFAFVFVIGFQGAFPSSQVTRFVKDAFQDFVDAAFFAEVGLYFYLKVVIRQEGVLVFEPSLHFEHDGTRLVTAFCEAVGEELVDLEETGDGFRGELEGAVQPPFSFLQNLIQWRGVFYTAHRVLVGW